jgi:hypothetical protein
MGICAAAAVRVTKVKMMMALLTMNITTEVLIATQKMDTTTIISGANKITLYAIEITGAEKIGILTKTVAVRPKQAIKQIATITTKTKVMKMEDIRITSSILQAVLTIPVLIKISIPQDTVKTIHMIIPAAIMIIATTLIPVALKVNSIALSRTLKSIATIIRNQIARNNNSLYLLQVITRTSR